MTLQYRLLAASQSSLLREGIERVYGATYPLPELCDPEFVRTAISSGLLHCVVALNSEGQVVGCASTVLDYLMVDCTSEY